MPSFTFNCSKCGTPIEADDEWRGQQAQCPDCNEAITIPLKLTTAPTSAPTPPRKPRVSSLNILLAVAVFAVIGVVAWVYLVKGKSSDQTQTLKPGNPAADAKLIRGIKENNALIVDEALREGASLRAKDEYGRYLYDILKMVQISKQVDDVIMKKFETLFLQLAAAQTIPEAEAILAMGISPHYKNKTAAASILHVCKDPKLMEYYITKYMVDVNAKSSGGLTPIFFANLECARILVKHGAKLDIRDIAKRNPLHVLALGFKPGDEALVKFLIENGVDLTARDVNGKAPYDLCEDPKYKHLFAF